jgi:hypothetical protein
MSGHGRSKNGVLKNAYVPGIHAFLEDAEAWMAGISPAMTTEREKENGRSRIA